MKVLITGAKGQLGQDLQKEIENQRIECIGLGHNDLDITDFDSVKEALEFHKPSIVINCAAYNAVDKAEENWKKAFLVNGIGVRNLAIISEKVKAMFVHFSTDYVFDGEKGKPYTIADKPNPINKYGQSKLLGEEFVKSLHTRYFLIRVSWVFGSGGKEEANFIKKLMKWAKDKQTLKVVDDQISSPTYTVDLAKAVMKLIKTEAYGLYHITNGQASRYEWAEYILKKINWSGRLEKASKDDFNLPAKRPGYSVLDNYGLKETINYEMPDWQDATDRFLKETGCI